MRILSGIQPSGKLHLGNYLGAIKQHIELQDKGESFYFIADYHALTSLRDKDALRENSFDVALDYLSLGLDPKVATFYRQSDLPQVTELAWFLSTVTPMGLLERCHSYKDKVAKGIAPDHGLFAYPVLMAADILIVDADIVPVGKDQKQHVEVTRDIAQRFNFIFGETLKVPEDRIMEDAGVVPGIDGQKMSKSYGNSIDIFLEGKELKDRVMSIVTDSAPVEEPKDPDTNNVYNLLKFFVPPDENEEWRQRFVKGGLKYVEAKKRLIAALDETFGAAREKRKELKSRPDFVRDVLREGAKKAGETATITLERVREAVGLGKLP
ncbi:MAG TPA: tryptophan--tRNA ligase [Acidobacteriota bacterium]|jgi:tryptophanyl-tRNA synthetase|nr:tryptophan--tRNA ligase [Acidobacteriota bacterium]HNT18587.1 tryptophan--tRNA ligase [Acidobacteriota bacterium]HPA27648.1 tryptophan--tRNA ligase [Acidobacteriota bacterium]HQO20912.1 tryptophan--tRNA ligase [Acidobacteriota bacterium]HQQ47790.1 tryptophan--tRNA ligase [Acidobacteriota bacterium]